MNQDNVIKLTDGRTLGFAEYGLNDGFPVLFFHGLPGSRLEAEKLHEAAINTKVRLIGMDRPGMGLSSPQKDRTVLSWADDIEVFTHALGLDRFSVIGHSGGAPYVAACAYRLPNKGDCFWHCPFDLPRGKDELKSLTKIHALDD